MGERTGIAWTDHTLNAWIGCTKVSAGCANCYAEHSPPTRTARHRGLELWGPKAARQETKGWLANLRKWDEAAFRAGVRRRVFAQSLSDTFEDRADLADARARLLENVARCTNLDVQLLTKRPENVCRMVPPLWLKAWPAHVWIGCTVEDQEQTERRIPHLLHVPARVRFLSVEPQLEAVDLSRFRWGDVRRIAWVIQGGESGPKARPFDLAWARSLRDQCRAAGVAYFLKQLGANPAPSIMQEPGVWLPLRDSHGGDESEWPADLRGCRAFPEVP